MTAENKNILETPYLLPCGSLLKNRIAKAALTEHLADADGIPNEKHFNLYDRWGSGGAALLLTGNVIIDRGGLEGFGNIVLNKKQSSEHFQKLAQVAQDNGSQLWMQIGHAGALSPCENSLSPSGLQHRGTVRKFPKPRIATTEEIKDVIGRFAYATSVARSSGFGGVQIHSAHGFLLNQFLSPVDNRRKDEWGGSLENRAKLLIEVVRGVRVAVGSGFPVAVKLNSSDGLEKNVWWSSDEAAEVAAMLEKEGVDLVEFSGGSYEATPMLGPTNVSSVEVRPEAFFLNFARRVRKVCLKLPIMLTGGMRSKKLMEEVVKEGTAQIIGVGRPFAAMPDVANLLLSGKLDQIPRFDGEDMQVNEQLAWFQNQIQTLAETGSGTYLTRTRKN